MASKFAIVTGASTGIGLELAKCCAKQGYDLVVAADEPAIEEAATTLRAGGVNVEAVQADLATIEGVERLLEVQVPVEAIREAEDKTAPVMHRAFVFPVFVPARRRRN